MNLDLSLSESVCPSMSFITGRGEEVSRGHSQEEDTTGQVNYLPVTVKRKYFLSFLT